MIISLRNYLTLCSKGSFFISTNSAYLKACYILCIVLNVRSVLHICNDANADLHTNNTRTGNTGNSTEQKSQKWKTALNKNTKNLENHVYNAYITLIEGTVCLPALSE